MDISYLCTNNSSFCRWCNDTMTDVMHQRKVGTTQSVMLPNGKDPGIKRPGRQTVPQKKTAPVGCRQFFAGKLIQKTGVRVKTRRKRPRSGWATFREGKPHGLKDQVYQLLRVARPMLEGRSLKPAGDGWLR